MGTQQCESGGEGRLHFTRMSTIEQTIRAQASDTVRRLNPKVFKSVLPVAVTHTQLKGTSPAQSQVEAQGRVQPTTDESRMNGLERAWWAHLKMNERAGNYSFCELWPIKMRLAEGLSYTPDFMTVSNCGQITAWETKGHMRPQALVKLKAAARKFRWMRFIVVRKIKGKFTQEIVKP